jgi:cytoskeletal protein RodZ
MPNVVRKTLISAFVLLLIFIVAGIVYVWYNGNHVDTQSIKAQPKPVQSNVVAKPPAADPNNPVGVAVQAVDSPVSAGQNANIQILTKPESKCTIVVTDKNKVASKDSGLMPRTADAYGSVTWTWTVAKSTPLGKGSVKVTCVNGKKSGVVVTELEVIK